MFIRANWWRGNSDKREPAKLNGRDLQSTTDEFTITIDGETKILTNAMIGGDGTIEAYVDSVSDIAYFVDPSAVNSSFAAIYHSDLSSGGVGEKGFVFGRAGETELPSSGTGQYSGTYFAAIFEAATDDSTGIALGEFNILADFKNLKVSGEIINREFSNDGLIFADIILEETNIDSSAEFLGAATGGRLIAPGTTVSSGTYLGLFAGSSGDEIVGGLTITHQVSGDAHVEYGAFAGTN